MSRSLSKASTIAVLILSVLAAGAALAERKVYDSAVETTHRKVTWDDFQGKGREKGRWEGGGGWAHLASGIEVDPFRMTPRQLEDGTWFVDRPDQEAYAVMDKLLSGVAPGVATDQLLAHEQLHFDITEAFSRRLTIRLWELEGRGATAQEAVQDMQAALDRIYNDAVERLMEFQRRYDSETAHGTRKKAQKKWSERAAELFAAATAELEEARAARAASNP